MVAILLGGALVYLQATKPHFDPIADLSQGDFQKLQSAAMAPANQGAHVELALSTSDVAHPKFYIASNQKDAHYAVTFEPIPGTFVQKMPQPQILNASDLRNHLAFTDRIEITEGEYNVKVSEVGQPQKVVAQGKFFLGGVKDATYGQALNQLHGQRKAQEEAELRDLNEASAQLDAFLEIIQEVKRDPKTLNANKVKWDDLEKGFNLHSILTRQEVTEETAVLSTLLHEGREVWKQFKTVYELENSLASPGANITQIGAQIDSTFTQALAALTAFKASLLKTNPAEIQ